SCLGFVSLASPFWKPDGWGPGLSWGTIAAGKYVTDFMLQITPGIPKAQRVATGLTAQLDANYPTDKNWQGAYLLTSGLEIHAFASYMSSLPVSANIQKAVRDVATELQSSCTLRTPSAIKLISADNLSAAA